MTIAITILALSLLLNLAVDHEGGYQMTILLTILAMLLLLVWICQLDTPKHCRGGAVCRWGEVYTCGRCGKVWPEEVN